MSKRLTRLSRQQFQDRFFITSIVVLFLSLVVGTAVFYDPSALFILIPFSLCGFLFGMHKLGGWIYDRRYRRF